MTSATGLDYCGYIGGAERDDPGGIAVDQCGNVYVTGWTRSDETTFPVKVGPDLTYNGNSSDAFVAKVMHCSLYADTYTLSESTGGTVNFTLDAGTNNADRDYILLGSISGMEPGFPLPGGGTLPLNWDDFTDLVLAAINSSYFSNFMGTLDVLGQGTAQFNTLGPFSSGGVNHVYFAYAVNTYPWGFASNPVAIEILP